MATQWQEVDVASLSPKARKAYEDYRIAQGLAKNARLAFEAVVKGEITVAKGYELVFGYKFGKLAVTLGEAKAASNGKAKVSLSDYLSQRQGDGLRT